MATLCHANAHPKTLAPNGGAGIIEVRYGTCPNTWHSDVSHFGEGSEIALGIMFAPGNDYTELAIDSDTCFFT